MSALPEWLWPHEDEEAVQEAERLIEETHDRLRRMEASMQDKKKSGQHISEEAEKLKLEVNKKMNTLEKELKSISEPTSGRLQLRKQSSANEHGKSKPVTTSKGGRSRPHQHLKASSSQSKPNQKPPEHLEDQQPQALNISTLQTVPKQWKNVDPKWSSSTAEQVVLTAKAKVQDALAVARNVTASLDHHVSTTNIQSKPMTNLQAKNVGIFEVKSQSDGMTVVSKQRLGQMLLPSISIKRGLEKQSIPSIQVLPGEKIAPSNVSVCNVKYADFKESSGEKLKPSFDSHEHTSQQESKRFSGKDSAFVQLSRQLAEVEELREVNQAQVNHVLRFLLSRVCNSTATERTSNSPLVTQNRTPDQQDRSNTTSGSDSTQYPIAYDSLSRFLETYKRAADQSMVARKRATVRRHKEVAKQKKEIKKVTTSSSENHLLIGPLRQATQGKEVNSNQPEAAPKDLMESYSTSSSIHQEVELNRNTEDLKENTNDSLSSKERDWNSHLESSKSSGSESVFLPLKPVGGVSGEEYEDDWEEEENKNQSDEGENSANSILPPIIEAEELVSSVTESENKKKSVVDSTEVRLVPYNLNITMALEKETEHPEDVNKDESKEKSVPPLHMGHSLLSNRSGQGDTISEQMLKIENELNTAPMVDESLNLSNVSSMSGKRPDVPVSPAFQVIQEKPQSSTHSGNKGKKQPSFRRRTQVRHQSLCSSSSDAEMSTDTRHPRNAKRWDLSLKEDLQLQSAILLNLRLEDLSKKNNNETSTVKDQPTTPPLHSEVLSDIERRWQRTLDQLDQRLKMMEDNDRIRHIANEIKLQSIKSNDKAEEKPVSVEYKRNYLEVKATTKDIMVQTSPETKKFSLEGTEFEPFPKSSKEPQMKWPQPVRHNFVNSYWQKPSQNSDDLTGELLKYSQMGILPRQGHRERQHSKSSTSSTTSSNFQQSSAMVSFSDGELRNSACGSCSCSEGEYCVCGGRKLCSERAPPDGSQTFSDGENFMKDVSQGEIPSSKMKHLLQDTSYGEIANHVPKEVLSSDFYMAEESIESDDIEWELK